MGAKRIVCTIASLLFILPVLSSCSDRLKIDPTKTQLYLGNYNGGYGYQWVEESIEIFEDIYKDISFEDGKVGVEVVLMNQKDEFEGYNFFLTINSMIYDVFLAPTPRDEIVRDKLILGLTDILDDPLTDFGEEGTIRDRLPDYFKEDSKMSDLLFLPYGEAYFGNFVYDVHLFEQRQLYLKAGGGWTGASNKNAGPDGIEGTFDDGLPVNENEFFALLDRMVSRGLTPCTWAGMYPAYMNAWALTLFNNYDDGLSQSIYNSLEGEYLLPGDLEPTIFDGSNFYDAQRIPSRLAVLKQVEKLVKNSSYYSNMAFSTSHTHIEAQEEFLYSVNDDERIAMLLEGSWWENEAMDTFNKMGKKDAEHAYKTRRLGLMPPVRISEGTGEKTTFYVANQAMFINASTKKETLAKLFLKFMCTDRVSRIFTVVTGTPAPYRYDITDEDYNQLSYFGKNIWDVHNNKDNTFLFKQGRGVNAALQYRPNSYPGIFQSNVLDPNGKSTVINVFNTFRFNPHVTAENYFKGIYQASKFIYDDYFAEQFGPRKHDIVI